MHPLLERQLRKLGLSEDQCAGPAGWQALLERVSRAYGDADDERYLLERSLQIASREMRELYESQIAADAQRFKTIVENANDAIYTIDLQGHFTSVNAAAERVTGYTRDELIGTHFGRVVAPEYHQLIADMTGRKLRGEDAITRFEIEVLASDGARLPVELSTQLIFEQGRPVEIVGVGRDLSDRLEHERLTYLAHHDPLTGLPNRYILEQLIARAEAAAAAGNPATLLFLDLDNFKLVNDSLGHVAGDELLVRVVRTLEDALDPGAVLTRVGGDEFAILLHAGHEAASAAAERVRLAVAEADLSVGGQTFYLGASIGLAEIRAGEPPDRALARADGAMYLAKERGRNRAIWASDERSADLAEASQWVGKIRAALADGRFEVHYQPVLPLKPDGGPGHYEALVRMRDEEGQLVRPGRFVAAAERFGLMARVDGVVVETAIRQLVQAPGARLFVNVSGRSLADESLLQHILSLLQRMPVGDRLGIELTETAVVEDLAAARRWMDALHSCGVRFALDDFGAGYSSMGYLRSLPIDLLKIDGSFIRGMPGDPKLQGMVRAIQGLADVLGVETVAESIENARILAAVRELGVTMGQGFYLGAPTSQLSPARAVAA